MRVRRANSSVFGTARPVGTAGESVSSMETTYAEIRAMELRRLRELMKVQAQHGPQTDPGVLIEIQDLRNKYPEVREVGRGRADSDYELLMNVVAAALQRLTLLEQHNTADDKARQWHQLVNRLWMLLITIIVFATLMLVLLGK